MSNCDFFIHIGYPKTATTFLQNRIFPIISEVQYLGKKYNKLLSEFDIDLDIIDDIIYKNESSLLEKIISYRKKIKDKLKNKKVLLSEEDFLSSSLRVSGIVPFRISTPCPISIGRKIYQIFNMQNMDVKVLITIRRQDEMILSLYAQYYTCCYSRYNETNTFKKFLNQFVGIDRNLSVVLNYNLIIKEYKEIFGKNNIYVLVFEELQKYPEIFLRRICNILKVDSKKYSKLFPKKAENIRSTKEGYKKTRDVTLYDFLGRVKHKYFLNLNLKLRIKKKFKSFLLKFSLWENKINKTILLSNKEKDLIMKLYEKDNRELSQHLDIDLKEYGYYN